MKNIDRWFILIGLLCGIFGFAFGIWMGVGEHFDLAPVHAHINLVGFASIPVTVPETVWISPSRRSAILENEVRSI